MQKKMLSLFLFSVKKIIFQRAADACKMHPDLVGSPGQREKAEQRAVFVRPHRFIGRNGGLSCRRHPLLITLPQTLAMGAFISPRRAGSLSQIPRYVFLTSPFSNALQRRKAASAFLATTTMPEVYLSRRLTARKTKDVFYNNS